MTVIERNHTLLIGEFNCSGVILSGDWSASRELIGSVMWSWVSGTACTIDYPNSVPAWFSPTGKFCLSFLLRRGGSLYVF